MALARVSHQEWLAGQVWGLARRTIGCDPQESKRWSGELGALLCLRHHNCACASLPEALPCVHASLPAAPTHLVSASKGGPPTSSS